MHACGKLKLPGETEAGNPGEEPAKGYPGAAHRTMSPVVRQQGRGSHTLTPPKTHRTIDRPCLKKRTIKRAATTHRSGLEKSASVQFPLNRDT